MRTAVIYARYSAGPRQTDQSIEGQISDCTKYAESHDLAITKVYSDHHVSGKSTEGRDAFLQMIADAKKGLFTDVIVWKVDRFGRDKADIAIYKRELRKAGVTLHYAAESVPDGPEGIILESLLEGLAEYYSADLRQKVERGMKESLKKGQYPGKLPFGYKKTPSKEVVVDPDEASIVREIFRLHSEGHRIAEIEHILTNKGIKMKNGSIYRILTNNRYTGKMEMMGIEIQVEPIISEELFASSKLMLKTQKGKGGSKMNYLLSGKCKCGVCGRNVTGTYGTGRNGAKHYYYQCQNHCIKPLPKEEYESTILQAVSTTTLSDELVEQIVDRIMEIQNEDINHAEIKRISAQISDINKRRENLLDAVEKGLYSPDMKSRIESLNRDEELLSEELDRLKLKKPTIPREYLEWWLKSFRSGDLSDDDFRSKIVHVFIAGIQVNQDDSVVFLNITNQKDGSNSTLQVNQTLLNSNQSSWVLQMPYLLLRVRHSGSI